MSSVQTALSKLRILILEDNLAMRSILRSILNGLGCHDIAACGSMIEALEEATRLMPDIILCDYRLEDYDGVEFIHQLRASPNDGLAMTPVIMVTSYTNRDAIIGYINAGADEVLAKPVSAEALYARIAAVVNRRRPFVRTGAYFGPDRRRKDMPYAAEERRTAECA
ncbi:MAG: response regulator [Maricaulaceae bacterium]